MKKEIKKYSVIVKSNKKEKNKVNNQDKTSIEIIDYSQKILILSSCIHPDIATLNWALEDQLKSKINTIVVDGNQEVNIEDYNLIIFYKPNQNQQLVKLIKRSRDLAIPSFTILGNNLDDYSSNNSLFGLGTNIFKGNNDVSSSLNSNFKSFSFNVGWENTVNNYPPISIPFSIDYQLISNANILLYQTINSIKMKYPLLYFYTEESTKHATLIGEGIWRWKMYEFNQNNNADVLKSLIKKIIQYLKKTEIKSRLNVDISNENFIDEPLYIYAEYYNELMEISTNVEITISYSNYNGDKFSKKCFK